MVSLFLLGCSHSKIKTSLMWKNKQQMILILAAGWHANSGTLWRFQYINHYWYSIGKAVNVSLGSQGLAWGKGLHPYSNQQGPYKKEGDKRSPVGIFHIGFAFGYNLFPLTKLSFHVMEQNDFCIDQVNSPYYNQIINRQKLSDIDKIGSSEPMRRDLYFHGDQLYKLGFVIEHNQADIPSLGSCIFAHLRKNYHAVTAGCTAMDEADMQKVLLWLDPKFKPVLVLLPISVYQEKRQNWQLPKINFVN